MGSVFKPQQPKKPEYKQTLVSYVDKVSGIEQVPVENADGSITYITRKLPKTEEEKLRELQLEEIRNKSLEELKRLSSADYELSDVAKSALETYISEKKQDLDESFDERTQTQEDELARRGLSDSTAANTVRRQTNNDKYDGNKAIGKQADLLKNDMRNKEVALQQNLYNLANSELNYDATVAQKAANGNLSAINAMNATNYASLTDYNSKNVGANSNPFLNSVLSPIAETGEDLAGTLLKGAVSGFVSSFTGGIL